MSERTIDDTSDENNECPYEVFVYMGRGQSVPKDVISVQFHPSVIEVNRGAFISCQKLKKVVFNEGLQKIGSAAFDWCTSLERITIPSTVIEIGSGAFFRCISLKEVVFNEGLKKIEGSAFERCESLLLIRLPSTLIYLCDYVFDGCSSLGEVEINEGIKKIGVDAFKRCESERLKFPGISTRIDNIIRAGQSEIADKILYWETPDIEWRDGEFSVSAQATRHNGRNHNTIDGNLLKYI